MDYRKFIYYTDFLVIRAVSLSVTPVEPFMEGDLTAATVSADVFFDRVYFPLFDAGFVFLTKGLTSLYYHFMLSILKGLVTGRVRCVFCGHPFL